MVRRSCGLAAADILTALGLATRDLNAPRVMSDGVSTWATRPTLSISTKSHTKSAQLKCSMTYFLRRLAGDSVIVLAAAFLACAAAFAATIVSKMRCTAEKLWGTVRRMMKSYVFSESVCITRLMSSAMAFVAATATSWNCKPSGFAFTMSYTARPPASAP